MISFLCAGKKKKRKIEWNKDFDNQTKKSNLQCCIQKPTTDFASQFSWLACSTPKHQATARSDVDNICYTTVLIRYEADFPIWHICSYV